MDKEKAREKAKEHVGGWSTQTPNDWFDAGFDAGYDARESGWVRVEDGLPTEHGYYLVTWYDQTIKAPKTFIGYWIDSEFRVVVHWRNEHTVWTADAPIAWMPLPQPYEEKS